MNILVVHNAYVHRGGEDVCVEREIAALREAGHRIELFLIQNTGGMRTAWQALKAPWGYGSEQALELRLHQHRPDLIHVHNLFPSLSPRVFRIARKLGVRIIATLHNFRPLCLNGLFLTPKKEVCERCAIAQSYTPGILRGCYRDSQLQSIALAAHLAKEQFAYDAVDLFIAPSAFLADKFIRYGFAPERIVIQGHFLPEMTPDAPAAPEPYLLYLGRLSDEKGLPWLLSVYRSAKSLLRLKIAGDGPLAGEARAAEQLGPIDYLGYLSGLAKDQCLRQAAAIVIPSECYENFPLAVCEANAWGVPVLAVDQGGLHDIIQPGVNGFRFQKHDAPSFWETTDNIWPESRAKSLRIDAQRYARQHFTKERFLQNRLAIYEKVLQLTTSL